MRRWMPILAVIVATAPGLAAADGLYEARSIVTGMDQRDRTGGLRRALGQVLAKVAGDPALADDPRLAAQDPALLLQGFAYLDRMSDIPRHDEQGSRDRPFDLVAQFDPAAVTRLLRDWGDAPWAAPRPVLAVDVTIVPRDGTPFSLRADTDTDERHRGALLAAADRFGLSLAIPSVLPPALAPPPGAPRLDGMMRWSDAAAGWTVAWRLAWAGGVDEWGIRGVGFDAAYRDGVGHAAFLLSGHAARPARNGDGPAAPR